MSEALFHSHLASFRSIRKPFAIFAAIPAIEVSSLTAEWLMFLV
jgi:hypothetical protein